MNVIIFTDINGNYGFGRNLGAYTIASYLRQHDITTQVIDFFASITEEEMVKIIEKFVTDDTKLVCFSNTFFQSVENTHITSKKDVLERHAKAIYFPQGDHYINKMFKLIKDINPNVKFVMGGYKTERFREHPMIDHWVVGFGEQSILKLVTGEDNSKELRHSYVDFEQFNMSWEYNDYILDDEALPLELSRGCPYNCIFCTTTKRGFNDSIRNIEIIKKELMDNYKKFGVYRYMIVDMTFNETPKKVKTFCDMVKSLPFKIEWTAVARLDVMYKNPWMRDAFLEAGAKAIWFGIESLNKKTLVEINKTNIDPDDLIEFLYFLRKGWYGKVTFGSLFIVGLPLETEESARKTLEWIIDPKCPLDAAAFYHLHIRGSDNPDQTLSLITQDMKKYGYMWHQQKWFHIHTGMNQRKAESLAKEFSQVIIDNKKLIPVYFYRSRLKTLKFTEKEMSNMSLDYKESFVESEKRRDALKEIYMERVLA